MPETSIIRFGRSILLSSSAILCLATASAAESDDVQSLIRRLSDPKPEIRLEACRSLPSLGADGTAASQSLVHLMVKERPQSPVWIAAADSLERVAPEIHTHVLSILLNNDQRGQARLGAAETLGQMGEKGSAALPAMAALWMEPSNNYKQSRLLRALHQVAPADPEVNSLILKAARGELSRVLLGSDCRVTAIELLGSRPLPDEVINDALFAVCRDRAFIMSALKALSERAAAGKVDRGHVATAYLARIRDQAAKNHTAGLNRHVERLGAEAVVIIPGLRELRFHPRAEVRLEVASLIAALEQAQAVSPDNVGTETWEVIERFRNGTYTLRSGARQIPLTPTRDGTDFMEAKATANGPELVTTNRRPEIGSRLQIQFQNEKAILAQYID